jgi:hypothetical protein
MRASVEAGGSPAKSEKPFVPPSSAQPCPLASGGHRRGPHRADSDDDPQAHDERLWAFFDRRVVRNLAVKPDGSIRAIMGEGQLAVNPVIA